MAMRSILANRSIYRNILSMSLHYCAIENLSKSNINASQTCMFYFVIQMYSLLYPACVCGGYVIKLLYYCQTKWQKSSRITTQPLLLSYVKMTDGLPRLDYSLSKGVSYKLHEPKKVNFFLVRVLAGSADDGLRHRL